MSATPILSPQDIHFYSDMMNICNASYYYTAAKRAPLLPPNAKELSFLKSSVGDAAALIVQYGNQNVLAHRGTELNWTSIAQNLKLMPMFLPDGAMIQGYYDQFLDINAKVEAAGIKIDVITGHSMGGAIAEIDGFLAPWYNNQPIVAFAPPKAVNGYFWARKPLNLTRFSYNRDPVINYPFKVLDSIDGWVQSPAGLWWVDPSFKLHWVQKPPVWCINPKDHVIGVYVSAFERVDQLNGIST